MGSSLIDVMSKSLSGLWERQEAISDNMANYETPGYKRKYVSFEDQLKQAIAGASSSTKLSSNLEKVKFSYGEDTGTIMEDGNSVDIEKESISMIKAAYQYSYSQRVLSDEFTRISSAIHEGK